MPYIVRAKLSGTGREGRHMHLIDFFLSNPAVTAMAVLALLLILVVPISSYLDKAKTRGRREEPPAATSSSHFQGTRFEFLLLAFGLLVLIALLIDLFG